MSEEDHLNGVVMDAEDVDENHENAMTDSKEDEEMSDTSDDISDSDVIDGSSGAGAAASDMDIEHVGGMPEISSGDGAFAIMHVMTRKKMLFAAVAQRKSRPVIETFLEGLPVDVDFRIKGRP